jgi:hypothetical protein
MTATLSPASVQTIGKTELRLAGADPTTAAEIVNSVQNFYRDFPQVAPGLGTVQIGVDDSDSYAYTRPLSLYDPAPPYCISLNQDYYAAGTRSLLEANARKDFLAGFHRYPTPVGTFEHELGHVLDMWLASRDRRSMPRSWYDIRDYQDGDSVSRYAAQAGPVETFADAFALWRVGLNPGNAHIRSILRTYVRDAGGSYA